MLRVPGNMFAAAAAALLAGAAPAIAQELDPAAGPIAHLPALAGDYFPLQSQAANRLYHVFIRYPEATPRSPSGAGRWSTCSTAIRCSRCSPRSTRCCTTTRACPKRSW